MAYLGITASDDGLSAVLNAGGLARPGEDPAGLIDDAGLDEGAAEIDTDDGPGHRSALLAAGE